MNKVMEEGPWMRVYPLVLQVWRPGVKLNPKSVEELSLWVTFPELGLQFWFERMQSMIASKVGRPTYTDKLTAVHKRWSYAQVLIDVRADKPLRVKIIFQGPNGEQFEQKVLFDWKPWHCSHCARSEHKIEGYKSAPKMKKVWVRKEGTWEVKTPIEIQA